jgi:hypothetical protein
MYYISSSKTANLRPKKSMKKWLESLNPGSLTNWFCMTRLLVYDQQLRSFPIKSMATNHAQDTSHILLSSPINMDEFHERERRKLKKKGGKNPTKNHHFCHQPAPLSHQTSQKIQNQITPTIPYNNPQFTPAKKNSKNTINHNKLHHYSPHATPQVFLLFF